MGNEGPIIIGVPGTPTDFRLKWINHLVYDQGLRTTFKADWVHRIHNDAKLAPKQVGLDGSLLRSRFYALFFQLY